MKIKYPPASAYRNPYVKSHVRMGARGPRGPQGRRSGAREQIKLLARSGKYQTQKCVADVVGVTKERVRQVLNEDEEFDDFGQRQGFRLEWPCPDCGRQISLKRSELRMLTHQPAVCRPCAADYCQSGRHRFSVTGRASVGTCRPCFKEWENVVVEVRTCKGCSKPLEITRKRLQLLNAPSEQGTGEWHQACYLKAGSRPRRKKQTHCERGHEFTEENTYRWRDRRQCRICISIKGKAWYARKKAKR